jgi:hypothetical protein
VAFANLAFHGLRVGDGRELTQKEVNDLYKMAGLTPGARSASRGRWSVEREDSELARRAQDRQRQIPTPHPTPGARLNAKKRVRKRNF